MEWKKKSSQHVLTFSHLCRRDIWLLDLLPFFPLQPIASTRAQESFRPAKCLIWWWSRGAGRDGVLKSDVLNGARHFHCPNEGSPPLGGWPVKMEAGFLSCDMQRWAVMGLRLRSILLIFGLIFNYTCWGWGWRWLAGGLHVMAPTASLTSWKWGTCYERDPNHFTLLPNTSAATGVLGRCRKQSVWFNWKLKPLYHLYHMVPFMSVTRNGAFLD